MPYFTSFMVLGVPYFTCFGVFRTPYFTCFVLYGEGEVGDIVMIQGVKI